MASKELLTFICKVLKHSGCDQGAQVLAESQGMDADDLSDIEDADAQVFAEIVSKFVQSEKAKEDDSDDDEDDSDDSDDDSDDVRAGDGRGLLGRWCRRRQPPWSSARAAWKRSSLTASPQSTTPPGHSSVASGNLQYTMRSMPAPRAPCGGVRCVLSFRAHPSPRRCLASSISVRRPQGRRRQR